MASIRDVAKLAKVSTTTVSRVIGNKGYVSPETRQIVLKAMENLEYTPSDMARRLGRRKGFQVGVVFSQRIQKLIRLPVHPYSREEFYSTVFKGIEDHARQNQMKVKWLCLEEQRVHLDDSLHGFILAGGEVNAADVERYSQLGKPFVMLDQYIPGKQVDCVVSNGYDGARTAVSFLIKSGMRRIFHVHGPLGHYGFKERYDGYHDAMKSEGLYPFPFLCDDIADNLEDVLRRAIQSAGTPDAIFAGNDSIALMINHHAPKLGLFPGKNLGLVGFDDLLVASTVSPPLCTVKVYRFEMGCMAVDRLRQLLYGESQHPVKISLYTHFVRRASCPEPNLEV
ncbi:MAG TPA: LacI family DNA-binding transcriptional regulator [Thermotogota bacterium]|nr:LacI family DNA-binding transcriptional regulator [Thermotogota bacterium]HRW93762.1 LacI family DNA-binding transcriptional regulator [Thermotogota bacterium]